MTELLGKLYHNGFYATAAILFLTGFYIVLADNHLIKKVIGINVMESAVFLIFVATGYVEGGRAPILTAPPGPGGYINPVPSALILTGIVVSVSVTAFSLALVSRIYQHYGTVDVDELARRRGPEP
ncbi:MAG: cation:proton antiporter subunit C [Bacillota bacterium]|nr:cation:proton antiporter subunit C [Bacillota bacterium]